MSAKNVSTIKASEKTATPDLPKKGRISVSAKGDQVVKTDIDDSKKNAKSDVDDTPKIIKASRFAGVEKGDAANKGTAYIRATFNVNKAKHSLKNYISKTLDSKLGQMNAHYPYTAIVEELILHIVRSSGKYNAISAKKADLYNITLDNIQRGMRESNDFGSEVKYLVDSFNNLSMDYIPTFFDTEKALKEFIQTKSFTNNIVVINNDALNFICFIIANIMSSLTRIACSYSEYAKKNNVLIRNFTSASGVYFGGSIREVIIQRLTEIEGLFSQKKADGEQGEEVGEVGEVGEVEEAEVEEDVEEEEVEEEEVEEEEEDDDAEE